MRTTLVLAAVLGLALTACASGGDDDPQAGSSPSGPGALGEKPEFSIPDGQPPAALEVRDLIEGEGEVVEAGDTLTMHYVGKSWSTGEQFDASWDSGKPFVFTLGAGQVIPGWDQGIGGTTGIEPMRVGGRRMLVIPPNLAYGEAGAGGGLIAPNETLVFVVDVLDAS